VGRIRCPVRRGHQVRQGRPARSGRSGPDEDRCHQGRPAPGVSAAAPAVASCPAVVGCSPTSARSSPHVVCSRLVDCAGCGEPTCNRCPWVYPAERYRERGAV